MRSFLVKNPNIMQDYAERCGKASYIYIGRP
jgi:hypothetical protein